MGDYTFKICNKSFGVTPISNLFIDKYMPSADGNFVKVYIAGLFESLYGSGIKGEYLSKKLGLLESDIIKAWEYWESKGLVKITKLENSMSIQFINPSQTALEYENEFGEDRYSPDFIAKRMGDAKLKSMHDTIQELLGRIISPKEVSMYLSWIDDYGFSPEVIILLVEYCKSRNKMDFRYIEKVAMGWHDSKIATVDDAQKYIAQHEKKYNDYRVVLDFLGLKENDLMKPQEEFLDKWFGTWKFSMDMVLEACKICSLRINEPNFNYIDGILSNWHKSGYKTLKDIEPQDSKKKTKNIKFKAPVTTFNSYDQRTYDIKDLEKKLLGRGGEEEDER
ncbi:MAG TPA: DNA replication protein DnaD [Clostridiaceae bacterium]|nr:DNA replication protein DnaD [Clostridiaceae bacterium]